MTRFQKEISGALGEFWARHAEEEVKEAVKMATEEAVVEENGAIKWKSNGAYLVDDLCEKLEYVGFDFSREATAEQRDIQNAVSAEQYRQSRANMTEEQKIEEMFEMRAAFGKGTVVVDVLTGERIQL